MVCIPDSRPHRVTNTKCRTDTVISPDDGHRPETCREKNKHNKNTCASIWLYLQDYTRMQSQQNLKIDLFFCQCFKSNGIPVYCVGKRLVFETLHSEERDIRVIPVSSTCFGKLFYPSSGALDCVLQLVV